MTVHERENPNEEERVPEEPASSDRRGSASESPSGRMTEGDLRVRAEAESEVREAKREMADRFWAGPKRFVEAASDAPYGAMVKRFLERFASLGDGALASEALKKTRELAQRTAEEPDDVSQG